MNHRFATNETRSSDSVTETIVSEIAAREDTLPEDLAPTLYEVVDPDALERLFRPTVRGTRHGTVVFPFNGYTVTITSDEHVQITTDGNASNGELESLNADEQSD